MISIDSKKLSGPCRCGHNHKMFTRLVRIESGCLQRFNEWMNQAGLTGKRAAVYDENTYAAKGLRRPVSQQEIVLPPKNLHANERATGMVLAQLEEDVKVLIAVGSGTIHDTVRYCAKERGIPFISCPTAASVDGFCSTVSAMTWEGFKKTMPGVAPVMVLADTEVIRQAPIHLALSGVGDILGKYTALLDWNIAHLLTDEFICPVIEDMTRQAVVAVHDSCRQVAKQDTEAFERLTYGLLLSGLAMQMMGNSRPASGAEHHISHFIEMEPESLPLHTMALHGEKVGVGTAIAAGVYHKLAEVEDIHPLLHACVPASDAFFSQIFGARLQPSVSKENQNDCMTGLSPGKVAECWPAIRKLIQELPTQEELEKLFREIGAKSTLEELNLDPSVLPQLLDYSPFVRNRLTLMRVRRMIGSMR